MTEASTDLGGLLPALVPTLLSSGPEADARVLSVEGALLYADISGFTTLSDRFALEGPAGAEALARLLTLCFGRLADEIRAWRGDLLRFAGDAPVALFPATDDDGRVPAMSRAAACALRLQALMPDLSASAGEPLSIRVVIAAGRFAAQTVGGLHGRREFIVGGPAFASVAPALLRAAPGDVVLVAREGETPDDLDLTRLDTTHALVLGARVAAPGPIAAAAPLAAEAARPFLSRSLVARIEAGQSDWIAEWRPVTSMFVTVAGLDPTVVDGPRRIDDAFDLMQQVIYGADGSINQFLVDDKGTTLVAAWGVPGRSHDNDAARATLAALDVASGLVAQGVEAGIGLATGRVFCGWRGNAARREFAVIGRSINLASRLSGRPGTILADTATRDAAGDRVLWADAGPLVVKGTRDPVATFAPVAESSRQPARGGGVASTTAIVGRVAEREILERAVAGLPARQGGAIFVEGEAGTGKSTLLAAVTAGIDPARVRVLSTAASPLVRTGALDVWRDLLEQVLDLPAPGNPDARASRLEAMFVDIPAFRDAVPLIGGVLGLSMPENDFTAGLSGLLRGEATREALVAVVQREAHRHPLLLVIDDAQWIDSLSWSALAALVTRERRVLVFVGHRPMQEPPPEWPQFARMPHVEFLRLDRLTDDEAVALTRRELEGAVVPASLVQLIVDKTAGHPLFVIELVRWLKAKRAIVADRGTYRIDGDLDAVSADVPATVEGVLLGRFDELPAEHALTLRVASVLGQTFSAGALAAIHPVDPDPASIARQLDTCERARFVTRGLDVDSSFAFSHALVHDVAYGLIVPTQRVAWHHRAATWLEAAPEPERPDAVLAFHWTRAEEYPRAVEYLDRAGTSAAAQGAGREPLTFLRRALDLTDRHDVPVPPLQRARWHRLISQVSTRSGDATGAGVALAEAFRLLGYPFVDEPGPLRRRLIWEIVRQARHVVWPVRHPPAEGLDALRAGELVRSFRAATDRAYFAADFLGLATWAFAMINVAESAGQPEEAAHGYSSTAYMAALVGLRPLAERWWRVGGATTDVEQRLAVLLSRALILCGEGQWARLTEVLDAHETIARRASPTQLDNNLVLRIVMEFQQGRIERAESFANALLDSALAQHNDQHEMWARQALETFLVIRGRPEEAEREEIRLAELLPAVSDRLTTVQQHAHAMAIRLDVGAIEEAIRRRSELADWVHTRPPMSVGSLVPFEVLARVSLAAWARAMARGDGAVVRLRAEARRDLRPLRRFARTFPYGRAYHALMVGGWHALAGHPRRAAGAWKRARRHATALGQAVVVAEVERLLAGVTRDRARAARHHARAEELERQLGFSRRFVDLDRWTAATPPAA